MPGPLGKPKAPKRTYFLTPDVHELIAFNEVQGETATAEELEEAATNAQLDKVTVALRENANRSSRLLWTLECACSSSKSREQKIKQELRQRIMSSNKRVMCTYAGIRMSDAMPSLKVEEFITAYVQLSLRRTDEQMLGEVFAGNAMLATKVAWAVDEEHKQHQTPMLCASMDAKELEKRQEQEQTMNRPSTTKLFLTNQTNLDLSHLVSPRVVRERYGSKKAVSVADKDKASVLKNKLDHMEQKLSSMLEKRVAEMGLAAAVPTPLNVTSSSDGASSSPTRSSVGFGAAVSLSKGGKKWRGKLPQVPEVDVLPSSPSPHGHTQHGHRKVPPLNLSVLSPSQGPGQGQGRGQGTPSSGTTPSGRPVSQQSQYRFFNEGDGGQGETATTSPARTDAGLHSPQRPSSSRRSVIAGGGNGTALIGGRHNEFDHIKSYGRGASLDDKIEHVMATRVEDMPDCQSLLKETKHNVAQRADLVKSTLKMIQDGGIESDLQAMRLLESLNDLKETKESCQLSLSTALMAKEVVVPVFVEKLYSGFGEITSPRLGDHKKASVTDLMTQSRSFANSDVLDDEWATIQSNNWFVEFITGMREGPRRANPLPSIMIRMIWVVQEVLKSGARLDKPLFFMLLRHILVPKDYTNSDVHKFLAAMRMEVGITALAFKAFLQEQELQPTPELLAEIRKDDEKSKRERGWSVSSDQA